MCAFLLAIPSGIPGGLKAPMGMHFGHCDVYTIVEIEDGMVKKVFTLPSIPHQQGGCLAPVQYLADHGVCTLLAGSMGMRPLMGFKQMGIDVFFAKNFSLVECAVQAFLEGKLSAFTENVIYQEPLHEKS